MKTFFDFAFLLQKKHAAQTNIGYADELPRALAVQNLTTEKQQLVLSLDMRSLEVVNELLEEIQALQSQLQKPGSAVYGKLHRDDDLYGCSNAHDQADLLLRKQTAQTISQSQSQSQSSQKSDSNSTNAKSRGKRDCEKAAICPPTKNLTVKSRRVE